MDRIRKISASQITEAIRNLCQAGNNILPEDIRGRIQACRAQETWQPAQCVLDRILENADIARACSMPICQDTGVVCVFLEIGQDVHLIGNLTEAVNEGVRRGYVDGYLRKSVVDDPIRRHNTGDNTPAFLYFDVVPGNRLRITVAPKGFGSENMSRLVMLKPSEGLPGVKRAVLETVEQAGPNACPPVVVGVGVGGTFDKAALLAKRALIRPVNERNRDPFYAALEQELLDEINATGIGPQGYGGRTTALAVNIETLPTHIAGLPVAINLNCHVTRHMSQEL